MEKEKKGQTSCNHVDKIERHCCEKLTRFTRQLRLTINYSSVTMQNRKKKAILINLIEMPQQQKSGMIIT